MEQYIAEQHVARVIHISLSKLRADRFYGRGLPYFKFGRRVLYRVSDIEHYMAQHRVEPSMDGSIKRCERDCDDHV